MPTHDSDPFDDPRDFRDYVTRLWQSRQRDDQQAANPEWGHSAPRRTNRKGVVALLTVILLAAAAAPFVLDGNGGTDKREPDPRPHTLVSPTDTTAICRDSTPSFSQRASGTCSGHGGVARWIKRPER
ncbi:MAG TPA: DUF3761 domain-containing protein [Longimicrobium sp.]|nr:DUF3761 domain-containing protein [Longimicrobium sp.]